MNEFKSPFEPATPTVWWNEVPHMLQGREVGQPSGTAELVEVAPGVQHLRDATSERIFMVFKGPFTQTSDATALAEAAEMAFLERRNSPSAW